MEFLCFRSDFDEAVGEAFEDGALGFFRQSTAEHFQYMLSCVKRTEEARQIGSKRRSRGGFGCGHEVAGLLSGQLELVLDIEQGDLNVAHESGE